MAGLYGSGRGPLQVIWWWQLLGNPTALTVMRVMIVAHSEYIFPCYWCKYNPIAVITVEAYRHILGAQTPSSV